MHHSAIYNCLARKEAIEGGKKSGEGFPGFFFVLFFKLAKPFTIGGSYITPEEENRQRKYRS